MPISDGVCQNRHSDHIEFSAPMTEVQRQHEPILDHIRIGREAEKPRPPYTNAPSATRCDFSAAIALHHALEQTEKPSLAVIIKRKLNKKRRKLLFGIRFLLSESPQD